MHADDDRRDGVMPNPSARHANEFRCETADYMISTGRVTTRCRPEFGLNSKTVSKWVQDRRCGLKCRFLDRRIHLVYLESLELFQEPRTTDPICSNCA